MNLGCPSGTVVSKGKGAGFLARPDELKQFLTEIFDGIDMKHHSGIISEFRRLYIKSGIFKSELSEIISVLFDIRTESDYDDFFVISKQEVVKQIENAESFVSAVEEYLKIK